MAKRSNKSKKGGRRAAAQVEVAEDVIVKKGPGLEDGLAVASALTTAAALGILWYLYNSFYGAA